MNFILIGKLYCSVMNYFFVLLLSFSGIISIKEEKDKKRRNLFILLYICLIGTAGIYLFGEFLGQMLYNIQN